MVEMSETRNESVVDQPPYYSKALPYPWRRYFARSIDMYIYNNIWSMVALFVIRRSETGSSWMNFTNLLASLVLVLMIEPLLLSRIGTTPGKRIFGLYINQQSGRNLIYSQALERTFLVLRYGMGFNIPIYNTVCNYKSYQLCSSSRTCDWELDDFSYNIKDTKGWRIGLCITSIAVLLGVQIIASSFAQLPINRGDITPEEFYENYNDLMRFHRVDFNYELNANGEWVKLPDEPNTINVQSFFQVLPRIELLTDDGIVTEVVMVFESQEDHWIWGNNDKIYLAYASFVGARAGSNPFQVTNGKVSEYLSRSHDDYAFTHMGVEVSFDVDYEGYMDIINDDVLVTEDDQNQYYLSVFRMKLTE